MWLSVLDGRLNVGVAAHTCLTPSRSIGGGAAKAGDDAISVLPPFAASSGGEVDLPGERNCSSQSPTNRTIAPNNTTERSFICRTSKMSHAGSWRDSWLCTRHDRSRRWLWRL